MYFTLINILGITYPVFFMLDAYSSMLDAYSSSIVILSIVPLSRTYPTSSSLYQTTPLTVRDYSSVQSKRKWPYPVGSEGFAIILGLLLSDGFLSAVTNSKTAVYSHHCATWAFLYYLTKSVLPLMYNQSGNVSVYYSLTSISYQRASASYAFLGWLSNQFYVVNTDPNVKRRTKVLPIDLLISYFTELSLAYWFMGAFEVRGR